MGKFDEHVGRDFAKDINAVARKVNGLVLERKRLVRLMQEAGWDTLDSAREDPNHYAPIIRSIRKIDRVTLEIE